MKLGIRIAKRTVQRYMRGALPAGPRGGRGRTFLRNHTVSACDFLQTYDVWFRLIFAFFIDSPLVRRTGCQALCDIILPKKPSNASGVLYRGPPESQGTVICAILVFYSQETVTALTTT